MLERVIRTWLAIVPRASVVAGRIMCLIVPTPIAGSHWSFKQKISWSIRPNQKLGILAKSSARTSVTPSMGRFWNTAASVPNVSPKTMVIARALKASASVLGSLSINSSMTGLELYQELPRSPFTALDI